MSSSNTTTSNASALTTSTSLRPRTKRLISGLSEGDESAPDSFDSPPRRIASPAPSPFDSRSASPVPAAHPQRTSSSRTRDDGHARYAGYSSWGRRAQLAAGGQRTGGAGDNPTFANLWGSSWTTLQGFASDLLGNDPPTAPRNGNLKARQKTLLTSRLRASSGTTSEWGPTSSQPSHTTIASGTKESRENAVRAQKRKDLLTRQDSSYTADALGKIKRRLSDDGLESQSAPPGDNNDRAALVYVHHVTKDDTLAGITIKYNCSAAVVRKANRMWPNDTVQTRQTIVLPVDACGVKGKPVAGPEGPSALDLLSEREDSSTLTAEEVSSHKPVLPNGDDTERNRAASLSTTAASPRISTADGTTTTGEPPWHHDSWVLFPNTPGSKPTEIARLSRRALGYFPPARRKSISLSDLDSPSTSLDLARTSTSTNTTTNTTTANNATDSSAQRPRRTRRLSNANNGYFPSYLAGPGGVGTMSSNVLFPGPAQDGLNKFFAKHLPDVAPPRNQTNLYQPELPLYSDEHTPTGSGAVTPSLLSQHQSKTGLGIEGAAGAIEAWVRRMSTKSRTPALDTSSGKRRAPLGPRTSLGAPGKGKDGVGDLIEMTDEFEIGDDDDDELVGREQLVDRDLGGARGRSHGATGSGWDYSGGAVATARTRSGESAYADGMKSGKKD